MRSARALLFCALWLLAGSALAGPARVIVIRHGEKPEQGSELNERGRQRARALVAYFQNEAAVVVFGPPAAVYAMAPKGPDGSVRAIQTVQPLADNLGLKIRQDFKKKQIDQLVSAIMADRSLEGRMVLVCWEHAVIPDIIKAFGWKDGPDKWSGGVYDRAWTLDFAGGKPTAFKDLPQHVLDGDSEN